MDRVKAANFEAPQNNKTTPVKIDKYQLNVIPSF
jgi:hypothetical protein